MTWDFEDGGYWCPRCGKPYEHLGGYESEVLDWQSVVRVTVHCRRRYRRACRCPVPATVTVTAPGPPKAIGKGPLSIAFIAMLITERAQPELPGSPGWPGTARRSRPRR